MFYLFKNSSLSQLSRFDWNILLEVKLYIRLQITDAADSRKLALIKPLIQFLLDIADIVFTKAGWDSVTTHKFRRKIVFLQPNKNILQEASIENQLWRSGIMTAHD